MGIFDTLNPQMQTPSAVDARLFAGLVERLAKVPGGAGLKTLQSELAPTLRDAQMRSWMGNRAADPLSSDQLKNAIADGNMVLDKDTLNDLKSRSGLNEMQTIEHCARLIPGLVRTLTPRGELPSETVVEAGLESLRRELAR